jgi:hypothetical protein
VTVVSGEAALYRQTLSKYLVQTAGLLLALPSKSDARVQFDTSFVARASDLLSTTRLLIDSPASDDAEIWSLMSDLELVLAQIVQLRAPTQYTDLDFISDALRDRELLPRIQSAVMTNANN